MVTEAALQICIVCSLRFTPPARTRVFESASVPKSGVDWSAGGFDRPANRGTPAKGGRFAENSLSLAALSKKTQKPSFMKSSGGAKCTKPQKF